MSTHNRIAKAILLLAIGLKLGVVSSSADQAASRVKIIQIPGVSKIVKAQIGADGTIHVLFDAEDGPRYVKSTDGAVTFGTPIAIVDGASEKQGLKFQGEDLAIGKDGRVHVAMANNAWKLKLPEREWGFYYSSLAPGAKEFSPVRNINQKPSEGFSLAADERGNVSACFLSGKLFTMVSHDDGQIFSSYTEPNPDWNPCDCCTTAATYGPDGKLALLYREETNNDRDMFVALVDEARGSNPTRTRISSTSWKANACPMTYFTITRTGTGYVAAWPTKGQVYFSRLDKSGAVVPPGEVRTPGTTGMRNGLLALSASDGTTLIGWKNRDVFGWQIYDNDARPLGETGSTPSSGGSAVGVVLRDGEFILFP